MTKLTITPAELFTRSDYERLPDGFPCELVEGQLVKEPAPIYRHQRVIVRLIAALLETVGADRAVTAPIDLFIDDHNVLQPDVAVFATALARDVRHIPTPQIVVEVLSPSTAARDRGRKTGIYLRAGVGEVWLIDPYSGSIEVHTSLGVTGNAGHEVVRSDVIAEVALRGADLIR